VKKKADIAQQLDSVLKKKEKGQEFMAYCQKHVIGDDDKPITFDQHRALVEIYSEHHPNKSILKGAQVGLSTYGIALSLWLPDQLGYNDIYYLPSDEFCKLFIETRVGPFLRRSPYFQNRMKPGKQAGLIKVGVDRYAYYRGLFQIEGAISIPSHANIYDEVDVLPQENIEWSEDRLAASQLAWQIFFSVGMTPGAGMDLRYDQSDQRKWIVQCQSCRYDMILEEEFPQNIKEKRGGEVVIVCTKCGSEIDRQAGRWVAMHPGRPARGYRVSQLAIGQIGLKQLWDRYKRVKDYPSKLSKFKCSVLAIVDAGAMQPINDAVLANCRQEEFYMQDSAPWSYCGIDVGDTCHIMITDILPDGRFRPLFFEACPSDRIRERHAQLRDRFHFLYTVADGMPYKTEMKKIAFDNPGAMSLRYYRTSDLKEGEEKSTDEFQDKIPTVSIDRNLSLDDSVDLFTAKPAKVLLPRKREGEDMVDELDKHLKMLVKESRIDARGNLFFQYKRNVPNHFGFAFDNARLASFLSHIKVQEYTGVLPVFGEVAIS